MPSSPSPPAVIEREPESSLTRRVLAVVVLLPLSALFLSAFVGRELAIVLGLIAAMVLAAISRDALQAAVHWNPPVIEVPREGYELGADPTITYRRKPKRVRDISDCQVQCRLVCEERVTYTQGSDTTTETRDMYEQNVTSSGAGSADGLVATIDIHISAHQGAPTFDLSSNEVRWFVEIVVMGSRLPRDSHTFKIDVAASLDPRYRRGLQDT